MRSQRPQLTVVFPFLAATASLAVPSLYATNVGGTITTNTIWLPSGNPYVLTSNLKVSDGVTLTITPGVQVNFSNGQTLTVLGTLTATGNAGDRIRFEPAAGAPAAGRIRIEGENFSNPAAATFRYCDFQGLAATPAAISSNYADLQLVDCTISNINSTAFRPIDSRLVMLRNTIHNTRESVNAVYCAGLIASNTIFNVNGNADAIDIDFGWRGPGDPSLVLEWNNVSGGPHSNADGIDLGTTHHLIARYNVVRDFADKGFSVGEASQAIIYNNLVSDCLIGVAVKDSSTPLLMNLTIVDCGTGISCYEKSGGAGGGRGSATNCIIWDCGAGITLDAKSRLSVGYSVVQGNTPWPGPGNVNSDPEFQDPLGHDWHLRPGSSAIDTGTNQDWMAGETDLDGWVRIEGPSVDMGVYERTFQALEVNLIADRRDGTLPLAVTFTVSIAGSETNHLHYSWDFTADGVPDLTGLGLGQVTNIYGSYGPKSVSLTVSNDIGEVTTVLRPDYIIVNGPDVVYVSPAGGHILPYTNWANAATNIEDAVAVGYGGTLVLVTNGVYTPPGGLTVSAEVEIRGVGDIAQTVISGGGNSRALQLQHALARVRGVTLTGGSAAFGAGAWLQAGAIENCRVVGNTASDSGGGLYLEEGAVADWCLVSNNTAVLDGGGAYLNAGGLLDHCWIFDNRTLEDDGGGVFLDGRGMLRNSLVRGNTAADKGGGTFGTAGSLAENCTVIRNTAAWGGGIRCNDGGRVLNTIAYFNSAPNDRNVSLAGAGIQFEAVCTIPAVPGDGVITNDPGLFSLDDPRLASNSACVGVGANDSWMSTGFDLDEGPRLIGSTVDLGAFESARLAARFDASPRAGATPLGVTFTADISGTNLAGVVYRWDFDGDGTPDLTGYNLPLVSNTYDRGSNYDVILTVSNAIGETAVAWAFAYITASPSVMYVATNGSHSWPYDSWDDAATNLQTAIDTATEGVLVLVGAGDYVVPAAVNMTKGITVRGLTGAGSTVLRATGADRVMTVTHSAAVVEGLTMTGGRGGPGGGLYLAGGTVRDCIISNNVGMGDGGGVYIAPGTVERCIIVDNRTENATGNDDGGGVYLSGTGAVLQDCVVARNLSADDGGGVQCNDGNALVRRCTVFDNTANDKGGGIFLWPNGAVEASVIYGNSAGYGGGVSCRDGGRFENCTVVENRALTGAASGGGLYYNNGGQSVNTIYYYNTAGAFPNIASNGAAHAFSFCTSLPAQVGPLNSSAAPLFVSRPARDFHLSGGSPGIDDGTNLVPTVTDRDGLPRPLDGDGDGAPVTDRGAFEFLMAGVDTDGDSMSDDAELIAGTSLTDPGEVLRITAAADAAGGRSLAWPSVSGRWYTLQCGPTASGAWSNVWQATGTGEGLIYTNAVDDAPATFYRVGVEEGSL